MKTLVAKFGGTSLGSADRIQATAERLEQLRRDHRLVVVVSAMAGETDRLLQLGRSLNASIGADATRELDALVATGEAVSAALLALALQARGVSARSFTAHQFGMDTDGRFTRARIRSVDSQPLLDALDNHTVCVVTGFQGTDDDGNLVTLGRGGSDTSAVAIGVALRADLCEIYKDVDGVFTADPRLVPQARKLDRLTYQEMLELASTGSKVLQIRSVELAMKHNLNLGVRSSFHDQPGTTICHMDNHLEQPSVTALSHDLRQAMIRIGGLPGAPDSLSLVLGPLAEDDISVDFITQNIGADGMMSVAFTIDEGLVEPALASLQRCRLQSTQSAVQPVVVRNLAKLTAVGIGMRTHAGVAHRFFSALTRNGIPIQMGLSTEIKVSCLVPSADCQRGLQALHQEFL